jgi:hypothetical protein
MAWATYTTNEIVFHLAIWDETKGSADTIADEFIEWHMFDSLEQAEKYAEANERSRIKMMRVQFVERLATQ